MLIEVSETRALPAPEGMVSERDRNREIHAYHSNLHAVDEIARRITESSGIHLTGRTVWEKAKRLGLAKKIGRSMLISIDDIPALLQEETKAARIERLREKARSNSKDNALAVLRRARSKRLVPKK